MTEPLESERLRIEAARLQDQVDEITARIAKLRAAMTQTAFRQSRGESDAKDEYTALVSEMAAAQNERQRLFDALAGYPDAIEVAELAEQEQAEQAARQQVESIREKALAACKRFDKHAAGMAAAVGDLLDLYGQGQEPAKSLGLPQGVVFNLRWNALSEILGDRLSQAGYRGILASGPHIGPRGQVRPLARAWGLDGNKGQG